MVNPPSVASRFDVELLLEALEEVLSEARGEERVAIFLSIESVVAACELEADERQAVDHRLKSIRSKLAF